MKQTDHETDNEWTDGNNDRGSVACRHLCRHEWRFDHRPVARWDPSIDRREHREMECIQQGIRSGELTRNEARQLLQEQRGIRQEERQYESDGLLTRDERIDLQQDLNAASQHIYNETHDADRRGFNSGFSR